MIYKFDCPFVFWTEVKNHKSIKNQILPFIKKLSENNTCTVTSDKAISTYYHQSYPYIQHTMLEDIIWKPLDEMMTTCGIEKPVNGYKLDGLWWNNYQSGGFTKVHKHERADWSGIYLLHLEEPNTTTFYAQYAQHPNSNYMSQYKTFDEVGEGNVMIFPSGMQHAALPCTSNRIIISFDIIYNERKIDLVVGS